MFAGLSTGLQKRSQTIILHGGLQTEEGNCPTLLPTEESNPTLYVAGVLTTKDVVPASL